MIFSRYKTQHYAAFLFLGACILLALSIHMVSEGALEMLMPWVSLLLMFELAIDLVWLFQAANWWISPDKQKIKKTLNLAAAAIILHAIRVLVFVLGRIGPWIDFDRKPEYRPLQYSEWGWLYFAGIMSVLGVIGVIVVWRIRHHLKKSNR